MNKIVKGYELFKMIAENKINERTLVSVLNFEECTLNFVFETDTRSIFDWLDEEFVILEDETDEIEELKFIRNLDNNKAELKKGNMHYTIRVVDKIIINKMNELVKAVNKLNNQDVSKETNCMTD